MDIPWGYRPGSAWRPRAAVDPRPQSGDVGAPDLLLRVAEALAPTDGRLAREVYLEALVLEISRGVGTNFGLSAVCKAAQAAPPVLGSPQATDLALVGLVKRFTEGYAGALPQLRRALDAFTAPDDVTDRGRWGRLMTSIAMELWDDQRGQDVAARQSPRGEKVGRGAPQRAMVDADLGIVVSTDYRSISADAYSKAVICNGRGRYEEARDAARWVIQRDDLGLSGWALSELVEASTRTGQNGLASQALMSLSNQACASGTDLALGIESRALLRDRR